MMPGATYVAEFLDRAPLWLTTVVSHNWPVLFYLAFTGWFALDAVITPSRPRILLLYGGIVLVAAFEYQKHSAKVVIETTNYLLGGTAIGRETAQFLLIDAAPLVAHLLGVGLLLAGVLASREDRRLRPGLRRARP
jgi:hypothetical protein